MRAVRGMERRAQGRAEWPGAPVPSDLRMEKEGLCVYGVCRVQGEHP